MNLLTIFSVYFAMLHHTDVVPHRVQVMLLALIHVNGDRKFLLAYFMVRSFV